MHPNKTTAGPAEKTKDDVVVVVDLHPFLREYTGGRIERLLRSTFVPSSEDPSANRGVATKDVVIDATTGVSARLFLPTRITTPNKLDTKLPVVVYVHGGSFCTESAFCKTYHNYARSLASNAGALVVSVEYRLAPEHPVPAAHDDAWAALQWAASWSDPWLAHHADPGRVFIAGDSAGGNIAYHTAVRASRHGMDIEGLVIVQPYFWGTHRLPSERNKEANAGVLPACLVDRVWPYVTGGEASNDDPRIDPTDEEISSLTCKHVLVAVAGKDMLRERGLRLAARIRYCRRPSMMIEGGDDNDDDDDVTVVESEGEDHGFHLYSPLRATSKKLMESIVEFINYQGTTADSLPELPAAFLPEPHELRNLHACETSAAGEVGSARPFVGVPTRPYMDVFGYGMAMKVWSGPSSMMRPSASLKVGLGNASKTRHGFFLGRARPSTTYYVGSFSAAVHGSSVVKNF